MGWSKYTKLQKEWESYINKEILPSLLKSFPSTKGMTQIKVAKLLVKHKWIEKVQEYTHKSVLATGRKVGFEEFQNELMTFKTLDGKIINAWENSYERAVAQKMVRRLKSGAKDITSDIALLDKATDFAALRKLPLTNELKKKLRKLELASLTSIQHKKELELIKESIRTSIIRDRFKELTEDTVDKVNKYQGDRLAQNQFQYSRGEQIEMEIGEPKRPQLTLQGIWTLSAFHKPHYIKGGVDPCEVFAKQKYFYDDDIPIPVKSTHFGCRCSMTTKVIEKRSLK